MKSDEYRRSVAIVGGGQLGRMLALAAAPLDIRITVLDPQPDCPASVAASQIVGGLADPQQLRALVSTAAVTTMEIEHVGVETLLQLEDEGSRICPSPRVLAVVADKLTQKDFFRRHGLPVVPDVRSDAIPSQVPVIEKLRRGGYDGRGVARIAPGEQPSFQEPSFFEECLDLRHEVAVLVCRFPDGRIVAWDPMLMRFDSVLNLVSHVIFPVPADTAGLEAAVLNEAVAIATAAARSLGDEGLVGLLAVELFITMDNRVILNEVAPRPHNCGHVTIETCGCNQFEQHLRAVTGLPAGDCHRHSAGVMRNIVVPADAPSGDARILGVPQALTVPGVSVHLYGKAMQKPGRKMGHLTAVAPDISDAIERADLAWSAIRFR